MLFSSFLAPLGNMLAPELPAAARFRAHVEEGREQPCIALVRAGSVAPDALDAETGFAPLHAAARAGHAACVRHLLAAGADTEIATDDLWCIAIGTTPLEEARAGGHAEAARALEEAGAAEETIRGFEGFCLSLNL